MGKWRTIASAALAMGALMVMSPTAQAFFDYSSCSGCHPGFIDRGPLHDLHVGNSQMTNSCSRCHENTGDTPLLEKCAGCHVGAGVRTHHRNAGTSTCGNTSCHPGDVPDGEPTLPPYYGMSDINIDHPCFVDPNGSTRGEDFSGDGKGLDNDGDLAYDFDDPQCEALPTVELTWGQIKALF